MGRWIQVCDVEKIYGTKGNRIKAVNSVSFDICQGEYIGIMGTSGSGKSTLLNMLATIDDVSSGHIFFEEKDITKMNSKEQAEFRKNNLGFVFQDFNLLDTLTLEENIHLAMSLCDKKREEIVEKTTQIMEQLDIYEIRKKFPYQVSGGQKQRCACARAMINEPKLILADEPTGALDSNSAKILLETFKKMNEQLGVTLLMVTHDAYSASYCDRILMLKDGKIQEELKRGTQSQGQFFLEILDRLAITGGVNDNA